MNADCIQLYTLGQRALYRSPVSGRAKDPQSVVKAQPVAAREQCFETDQEAHAASPPPPAAVDAQVRLDEVTKQRQEIAERLRVAVASVAKAKAQSATSKIARLSPRHGHAVVTPTSSNVPRIVTATGEDGNASEGSQATGSSKSSSDAESVNSFVPVAPCATPRGREALDSNAAILCMGALLAGKLAGEVRKRRSYGFSKRSLHSSDNASSESMKAFHRRRKHRDEANRWISITAPPPSKACVYEALWLENDSATKEERRLHSKILRGFAKKPNDFKTWHSTAQVFPSRSPRRERVDKQRYSVVKKDWLSDLSAFIAHDDDHESSEGSTTDVRREYRRKTSGFSFASATPSLRVSTALSRARRAIKVPPADSLRRD